jgi:uncharacterized membrane protein
VLLRGYRNADLTVVYPLARGSGPLLSSMVAIVFLDEEISALGFSGIAAVVIGVFIATYTVIDGYAVKIAFMSPILVDYIGNLARLVFLLPPVLRDPQEARVLRQQQWKYASFVGIIALISYVLVLYAMQVAPLSHVAPAREVSMLFAALLGGQLLGEGDRVARILGALCIGYGVMALATG